MTSLRYWAWTKAIRTPDGFVGYHPRWIVAKRAWFKVFADRVECSSLVIPADAVTDAVVYEARQWFLPVRILSISTSSETWQFGFNPWANVTPYLPFPFRREAIQLHYSLFSTLVRMGLIAYVIYLLIMRLAGR